MSTQYPSEREEFQWALNAERAKQPRVEPTPEPETCEWTRRGDYFVASCKSPRSWAAPDSIVGWKGCPYCLKPLRLVPSEEPK